MPQQKQKPHNTMWGKTEEYMTTTKTNGNKWKLLLFLLQFFPNCLCVGLFVCVIHFCLFSDCFPEYVECFVSWGES